MDRTHLEQALLHGTAVNKQIKGLFSRTGMVEQEKGVIASCIP